MFYPFSAPPAGVPRLHSADLSDMRAAILSEDGDDDGPDGGNPHLSQPTPAPSLGRRRGQPR